MSQFITGKKGVLENIKNNKIKKVYVKHHFPELLELKNEFNDLEIIYKKDNSFYSKFLSNHQFIVGEITQKNNMFTEYNEFIENFSNVKVCKLIMLDQIQDPGNFGSIIRTAESFGVLGIIYKKDNQAQINDVVIKTSAGAISNVFFLKTSNLQTIIEKLKKDNYWIISSSLEDDSIDIATKQINFDKTCLILGNEEKGISKNIIANSDVKVKIPMKGITQSLNVAVSCGILLFYLSKN